MGEEIKVESVWLDYAKAAADPKLTANLSGVAVAGEHLWTVSDEGRSIECLAPHGDGYRLSRQVLLDDVFEDLPGRETKDEADIEAVDVFGGRLWICGSHCRVRRQARKTQSPYLDSRFRARPSRRLLGTVELTADGSDIVAPGQALPFRGKGSLRRVLAADPFIAPFAGLPSKENGLDIEGMTGSKGKVLLGLRGPIVDSIALVAAVNIKDGLRVDGAGTAMHFLDLGGLGVRDLARWGKEVLILAGPVSDADGPFRLFGWTPRATEKIQRPHPIYEWPKGVDRPEGVCELERGGRRGVLILYDTADKGRVRGRRYRADWMALRALPSRSAAKIA